MLRMNDLLAFHVKASSISLLIIEDSINKVQLFNGYPFDNAHNFGQGKSYVINKNKLFN